VRRSADIMPPSGLGDHQTYRIGSTNKSTARKIQPRLAEVTVPAISTALGVSGPYATDIRAGKRRPHPRHWEKACSGYRSFNSGLIVRLAFPALGSARLQETENPEDQVIEQLYETASNCSETDTKLAKAFPETSPKAESDPACSAELAAFCSS